MEIIILVRLILSEGIFFSSLSQGSVPLYLRVQHFSLSESSVLLSQGSALLSLCEFSTYSLSGFSTYLFPGQVLFSLSGFSTSQSQDSQRSVFLNLRFLRDQYFSISGFSVLLHLRVKYFSLSGFSTSQSQGPVLLYLSVQYFSISGFSTFLYLKVV